MPNLKLEGVNLAYKTTGSGPGLLLIPGAPGNGTVFRNTIEPLSRHFSVKTFDRRGYSGSVMIGAQDYANRLASDASDAAELIKHVYGEQGAFVFGTSSGAIVAQQLLSYYPEVVIKCIAHEPPSLAVLPDRHAAAEGFKNVIYPLYRAQGPEPALGFFFQMLPELERKVAWDVISYGPAATAEMRADVVTWFERELNDYPVSDLDIDLLKTQKEKYIPCEGTLSKGSPAAGPVNILAAALGVEILDIEGGHLSYHMYPQEFVDALLKVFF